MSLLPKLGTILTKPYRYHVKQRMSNTWIVYYRNKSIGILFGRPTLLFKPLVFTKQSAMLAQIVKMAIKTKTKLPVRDNGSNIFTKIKYNGA